MVSISFICSISSLWLATITTYTVCLVILIFSLLLSFSLPLFCLNNICFPLCLCLIFISYFTHFSSSLPFFFLLKHSVRNFVVEFYLWYCYHPSFYLFFTFILLNLYNHKFIPLLCYVHSISQFTLLGFAPFCNCNLLYSCPSIDFCPLLFSSSFHQFCELRPPS